MQIEIIPSGSGKNLTYLVADDASGEAMVIDPSFAGLTPADLAMTRGWRIRLILATHRHGDHIASADRLAAHLGARWSGFGDRIGDIVIADGAVLRMGGLAITVLHTPGHTADSVVYRLEDALFTGDTLFADWVGKTWSQTDARTLMQSLKSKLWPLDDALRVFPGHDYGAVFPTTIGRERRANRCFAAAGWSEFSQVKVENDD